MSPVLLPVPSLEGVRKAQAAFDGENEADEWVLSQLFAKFPRNTCFENVLTKTRVLNALYSTRLTKIYEVADHIVKVEIDDDLANGNPEVVDRIAEIRIEGKIRNNFSFASKYCSWHRSDHYPIYDSRVEECLWHYKKKDGFAEYQRTGYRYPEFVQIVNRFRSYYGLDSVSYKQLDKFLYRWGGRIIDGNSDATESAASSAE